MSSLGEKYIAGFLDADGSIGISWRGGKYKPQLTLSFSQKTSQDEVLHLIQKDLGGMIRTKMVGKTCYSELCLRDKPAVMALNRIKKYLVVKRRYADVCLQHVEAGVPREDWKDLAKQLKVERRVRSLPLPKHPTRKWLAGYFDGDGCVYGNSAKGRGKAIIELSIASSDYDTEGLEIIHKVFGGGIYQQKNGIRIWKLFPPPSKLIEFFEFFGAHSVVKKDQIDFILACAKMGHLRDGERICQTLKHLKAQPHRLSESKPDVHQLIKEVRDISESEYREIPVKRQSEHVAIATM